MPNDRIINLNFFQLSPYRPKSEEDYKNKYKAIQEGFSNLPDRFKSLRRVEDIVNLYGNIQVERAGYLLGTLVKTQMNNIPPRFDNDTQLLSPLELEDNQGLGYPTSFLYDPQTNIVMLESVRGAVGASAFCSFFHNNIKLPKLEPSLVINPVNIQDFYKMKTITKFEVRIARLENGSIFRENKKKSFGQIIDSADETNTNVLEYKLSASRNGSLTVDKIKDFVSDFLKVNDTEEVKTLKVTGKELDEDRLHPIDFIKQRLRESIVMEQQRLIGNFYIQDKYQKMEDAFNRHRQALINAYSLKE